MKVITSTHSSIQHSEHEYSLDIVSNEVVIQCCV